MTFAAVDASGGGEWLPQHPKSGDWYSLKGKMMTPPLQMPLESTNHMNPRPQAQSSIQQTWDSTVTVNTGETGGGGAMAK